MIPRTLVWIKEINKRHNIRPEFVLEVGSKNTNGSPRKSFPSSEYHGIDIQKGVGVDQIMSAYDLSKHFQPNTFDAILCLHVFEHLLNPWGALNQINLVLKSGGFFYMSVPGLGFPKHNHPKDYWRMTDEAVRELFMAGYKIISFERGRSRFGKHPIINCLGVKK